MESKVESRKGQGRPLGTCLGWAESATLPLINDQKSHITMWNKVGGADPLYAKPAKEGPLRRRAGFRRVAGGAEFEVDLEERLQRDSEDSEPEEIFL